MKTTRYVMALAVLALATLVAVPAAATDTALVVGGEEAVSPGVVTEVESLGLSTDRVEGPNRYATSVAASQRRFPAGADTVVLASGADFADGMAGVPLAHALDAPLLLTRPDDLPTETRDELVRLGPDEVVVLGGPDAVSGAVLGEVAGLATTVRRIAGDNRHDTAARIAREVGVGGGPVFVVRGDLFADALSIGPVAATAPGPILFVRNDELPRETRAELRRRSPAEVIVVGGMEAVSVAVEDRLGDFAPVVRRWAGATRSGTSVVVARNAFGDHPDRVLLATTRRFPDAFAAGTLASVTPASPVLLVGDPLGEEVREYLTNAAANQAPVAADDDAGTTDEDTVLDLPAPGVLANDTDPDGDDLQVLTHDALSDLGAAVTVAADGTVAYDPTGAEDLQALATGDSLVDTFTYTVQDPLGDVDTATVTVTVTGVPDAPVAVDDQFTTDEDTPLAVPAPGVVANDTDPEGDALQVTAHDAASDQGAVVTIGPDGALGYDPTAAAALQRLPAGGSLDDTFTYEIEDATGMVSSATVRVTVDGVNDQPAIDQASPVEVTTTTEAAPGDLGLVLTASDVDDGDVLAWSIDTPAASGTGSVDATSGEVDYLPDPGFVGDDTFTVAVDDGNGGRDTVVVEVTVVPPNAPPEIDQGETTSTTVAEDSGATPIALSATDPDGDDLTWSVTADPDLGTAVLAGSGTGTDVEVDFTPGPDEHGTTSFEVTVDDGTATDTITVEVTVTPVNDPPTVTPPGAFDVIGNVGIEVPDGAADLLAGAADDADGDAGLPLSVTTGTVATTAGGTVTIAADGSFDYEPPPGHTGDDDFDYEVCDAGEPGSECTTATVELDVAETVWFIDGDATGDDLGTLAHPFTSVASFNGSTGGDVHLAHVVGGYDDGIVLAAGQHLVGEGASGASLAGILALDLPEHTPDLPPVGGTDVVLAPTGEAGISLASDNAVHGIDVAVTGAGAGITGTAIGTTDIADVDVTTEDGPVLDLAGGTGTVAIGTATVTSRAGTGLRLAGMAGTVGVDTATIPNPARVPGNAVHVQGGSADVTIGSATIEHTVVGTATTFDGAGVPTNDGDGDAVFLRDTTGSFTLSGGTISDFGDNAIDVRNADDVTLTGVTIDGNSAGNSGIQAHVAEDLTITGTTIREIDNVNAAPVVTDAGMRLREVEGAITIQDSTIRDAEGYVLANGTTGSANRAVELSNRNGCTRDGDADCTATVTVSGTTVEAWDFQGLSLRHVGGSMVVDVDGTGGTTNTFRRINGAAVSTGPSNAASSHAHTTTVTGSTFDQVGIAAEVFGSRGGDTTASVTNNTVTTTTSDAVRLLGFNQPGAGATGTYRGTVAGNSITGVAGHLHGSGGGSGVLVAAEDSSVVRALVENNTVTGHTTTGGNSAEAVRTQNQRNGDLDLTLRDNTFRDFPTNFFGAVFIGNDNDTNTADGVTDTCVSLSDNTYANAAGTFGNTHAFDTTGQSRIVLPGYNGTTNNALTAYLNTREATPSVTGVAFGNQPVGGAACTLP